MAKFNKLDVPYQWKDEFTKYPHGYTIFEALCKWTKQVDDMVDNQNNWNDYLDNFVANFEFELQEEVQLTIERWQSEGLLDGIIESALNTELDNINTELDNVKTQLAHNVELAKKDIREYNSYFWKPELKNTIDPANYTPTQFYGMIEGTQHPYFSVSELGVDQSGDNRIMLYEYAPPNYEKTIFLTAGVHGGETFGPYFIVSLFKMLTGNEKALPPQFRYIRDNVRILAIPVVNPWGMYQNPKKRYNSRGVDINRNFNWRWEQQADDEPFNYQYKGTEPFSEKESQYVDSVFAQYKDIVAYIDIHNYTSPDPSDYLVYGDTKTEEEIKILLKYLTRNIDNPKVHHHTTANDASATNYASHVVGIPSVTIEAFPTNSGSSFETDESINKWFEFIGNAIVLFANYKKVDRGLFSTATLVKSYQDGQLLLENNVPTEITDSEYSTTPLDNGFIIVNGFCMAKNLTNADDIFTAKILIEQEESVRQKEMHSGAYTTGRYPVIPLNAIIPVIAGKPVTIKIQATNEGNGECNFKRFNINILYTSAYNSRRFMRNDTHWVNIWPY